MILFNLDTVIKYRNTKEYRYINRCFTEWNGEHIETTGDGPVIHNLARKVLSRMLLSDGDPLVYVYRGDTLCFNPVPLSLWGYLTTTEPDNGSVRIQKYTDPKVSFRNVSESSM